MASASARAARPSAAPRTSRLQQPQRRDTTSPRLKVIVGGRQSAQPKVQGRATRIHVGTLRGTASLTFVAIATTIVAACVFGVVLLQVMLAQTSFELHKVHSRLVTEETKYRRMRFEVANAEAPEKIHQAAANLGLVVPAEQRYVFGPDSPDSSGDGSTRQAQQPNDKAGLKAVLSKQP